MTAGTDTGLHGRPYTLPRSALAGPRNGRRGRYARRFGCRSRGAARRGLVVRMVRDCWGFAAIRRAGVVESGASIDGSLLYGDLPALDGAETTDIAEALVSEPGRRPQHPKSPGSRVGVERAYLSVDWCRACAVWTRGVVDRATPMSRTRMVTRSVVSDRCAPWRGFSCAATAGCGQRLREREVKGGMPRTRAVPLVACRRSSRIRLRWSLSSCSSAAARSGRICWMRCGRACT